MLKLLSFFKSHYIFSTLLAIALFIGISIHKDYGITSDEPQQRSIAWKNIDYVLNNNQDLFDFVDKDYGAIIEVPLFVAETILFELDDYQSIYNFRHLMMHLLFLLGGVFLYLLLFKLYNNHLLAIIGFITYLLQPRIYAHSFFNSKDIPFMVLSTMSLYFGYLNLLKPSAIKTIILSVFCAFLINLRLIGLIVPLFFLLGFLLSKENATTKQKVKFSIIGALVIVFTIYVISPFLWYSPISNIIDRVSSTSSFRWHGSSQFIGDTIKATNLPWYYLPFWIGVTSPIITLVLFFAGTVFFLINVLKKRVIETIKTFHYIVLLIITSVMMLVFILSPVIYDGWRHFFFLYPLLILLVIYFLNELKLSRLTKIYLPLIIVFGLHYSTILRFMVENHPFQQVYFNEILSKSSQNLTRNFERDYWGSSFYQGILQLSEICNNKDTVIISSNIYVAEMNLLKLSKTHKPKFIYTTEIDSSDYFLSTYRYHPQPYSYSNKILSVVVQENTILDIWKLK